MHEENKTMLTEPRCSHADMNNLNLQNPLQNPKQVFNASLENRQQKVLNTQEFIDIDRVKFLHASIGGTSIKHCQTSN